MVVSNPSREAVHEIARLKSHWTIQDNSSLPVGILDAMANEEGIEGKKGPTYVTLFHKRNNGSFFKRNNKQALSFVHFYSVRHSVEEPEFKVPYSDINSLMYHEVDWGASIMTSTLGPLITIGSIGALIACNCPYMDVIDENGVSHFQGTMFPGAIFESLERTDRLVMDMSPSGEQVQVRISNALPEREYINEVKLFRYEIEEGERLAINSEGELVAIADIELPESSSDNGGNNWADEVAEKDGTVFGFDNVPSRDEFNRLDLQFQIPEEGQDLNLVINAKQSEWLENVANNFFSLFGTRFDDWVAKNDKKDSQSFAADAANRGLSLRVLAKVNGEYQLITWFQDAGTKSFRDMIVNLPPGLNYGEKLEIRLESAYRFWEIDQVALANSARDQVDYEELPMTSAITNKGNDASASLADVDGDYSEILKQGDYVDLNFENLNYRPEVETRLVLKGTGYYHHERNYTNEPNMKALRQLKKRMSTHQLSQVLEIGQLVAKSKLN